MPTLVFGILVLVLVLWALNAYRKADPKMLAKLLRPAGGIGALAVAAFLGLRGHFEIGDPARAVRPGPARLGAVRLDRAVPAHAEDAGPGVAGALGLRRDGARPRQRRDARPHPRRAARGRSRSMRST